MVVSVVGAGEGYLSWTGLWRVDNSLELVLQLDSLKSKVNVYIFIYVYLHLLIWIVVSLFKVSDYMFFMFFSLLHQLLSFDYCGHICFIRRVSFWSVRSWMDPIIHLHYSPLELCNSQSTVVRIQMLFSYLLFFNLCPSPFQYPLCCPNNANLYPLWD